MTVYKIHDDVSSCQSLTLDTEDFLDLLDPHIGESAAMQLGMKNIKVGDCWESLELSYFHNEGTIDLADVSMWRPGIMLLNQKAYDSLSDLLAPFGEVMPCELHGGKGYFFNCLNLQPTEVADVEYRMHKGMFVQVESIAFPESLSDDVFKHQNETAFVMYCSERFVAAVEASGLRGLLFTKDLAAPMP